MDRRAFLKTSLGVTAGLAAASLPWTGKPALAGPSTRTLRLYNVNNRERLSIEYVVDGWYNPDAQQILDEFLRDWRTHEVHPIDSQLLDYVFAVANELNFENHVNVVSAFRSRSTNNRLVRSNGAARNSYHLYGRAMDLRMPGVRLRDVRAAAVGLHHGGVGYYPRSDFLHIDTGEYRTW